MVFENKNDMEDTKESITKEEIEVCFLFLYFLFYSNLKLEFYKKIWN